MKTYAVRGSARKITGHYRRPGTRDLYCGRAAGARNGLFATVTGWKLCTRCVKAEALDRANATATAEAWLDTPPATVKAETAGTWRAEWISTRATSTAPTLFDVDPDTEQGALFA